MRKRFDTGNAAITEAAILAGCNLFSGYPITPATEIAENMSRRLPQTGGYYIQAEDELAALYIGIGGALGGLKAMTATSGPGYVLYADPYGWAIGSEIPVVIINAQRVGPVSGITGAPGQGEFYLSRYPTHGGNFETIVLAPASVPEAFSMTVEAFALAERFRTPVTILADQMVTDGWESFEIPENPEELHDLGLEIIPRRIHPGPQFYPPTDEIDIPPVVLGAGTGGACSDWTPTEEGYDTEEIEAQMKHAYRLIYKIRSHRDRIDRYESFGLEDNPELILVSYGSPSRVVERAVKTAKANGYPVGYIRLKSLWPFQDALFSQPLGGLDTASTFSRSVEYLVVELNIEGQLVREVERAAGRKAHFIGTCGDLPAHSELIEAVDCILKGQPLKPQQWKREVR
jgi:2-oxoglutarate ferredoxin oxidoreductase subunit alpha